MKNIKMLQEKMCAYMAKHHMIQTGDLILCGVSGGADSICMLNLLLQLSDRLSFRLAVCHVNHGIRDTAGRDEDFVKAFCEERGIPFYSVHENIPALAKRMGISTEEAGREARYKAFEKIANEIGATKIALAHTANDRAETQLYHLFRGTGVKGLAGIRPVRDRIIRPILFLEREEIEEYLALCQISFVQDETNEEDEYTRNRIRHHILPYAKKEISSAAVSHMSQTADLCEQLEDFMELEVVSLQSRAVRTTENGFEIWIEQVLEAHPILQSYLCHKLLLSMTPGAKDIGAVHVDSLLSLLRASTGKQLSFPFAIEAVRQYDTVRLYHVKEKALQEKVSVYVKKNQSEVSYPYGNGYFEFRIFPYEQGMDIMQNEYTKWFDYGKIKNLEIRSRESGDTLSLKGKGGEVIHKSLKEFFINEKIQKNKRDEIPLLADGANILWVVGYRISENYKISDTTELIMEVKAKGFHEGGKDGRAY